MALTKVTGQVINNTTGLVVGVTTVGGGISATDGFFSGIVTAVGNASFSGNVSVGGTLTYEDVTNIDAVGLVTARNGIVVGSGITLSKDGDVFFTGIATGNGSGLTALNASNIASGTVPTARLGSGTASSSTFLRGDSTFAAVTSTTINNNADNRVITGSGSANTLEGESNLTFTSDVLQVSSTTQGLGAKYINTGNEYTNIQFSAARTAADNALGILNAKWNNNHEVAAIYLTTGDDTTNKDDGKIKFYTSAASGSLASRMEILNDGNVKVSDGDLVIGTSGHGIDFSAASGSAAGSTSAVLDDYEEGTYSPTVVNGMTSVGYDVQAGYYRKIGSLVEFNFYIQTASGSYDTDGNHIKISLPFTQDHANQRRGHGVVTYNTFHNLNVGHNGIVLYIYDSKAEFYNNGSTAVSGTNGSNQGGRYLIGGGHFHTT